MWRSTCGNLAQRFLAAGRAARRATTQSRNVSSKTGQSAPTSSLSSSKPQSSTSTLIADLLGCRAQSTSSVGSAVTTKRLLGMLDSSYSAIDDPEFETQLHVKTVDEELVAYLCLQKIMQVYDDDHFEPEEKIAQLLSDSMNVVPGLHHTITKRLGRFINLRGQDSLKARTKFRKDMRKLLAGNLACPDYMIFLMQRLWHSSHWNHDDVLVHEAQANLQSIWIPELKTLYKVLKWENEHFHEDRASIDELIHRVVIAHKFISGRLPRRAQLGLYQKLAKFHSQQIKLAQPPSNTTSKLAPDVALDAGDEKPKKSRRSKKKRRKMRRPLNDGKPTSVLQALAPILEAPRYTKVRGALEWIFGSVGDEAVPPSDDLQLDRLTPIAKTLVRIKLYLDKFDDAAEMARLHEQGEWAAYEGHSGTPSEIDVHDGAGGVVPFDLPAGGGRPGGAFDDDMIRNSATGQTLSRYTTHEAARVIAAEQMEAEEQNWIFRGRNPSELLYVQDIFSVEEAQNVLTPHKQTLVKSLSDKKQQRGLDGRVQHKVAARADNSSDQSAVLELDLADAKADKYSSEQDGPLGVERRSDNDALAETVEAAVLRAVDAAFAEGRDEIVVTPIEEVGSHVDTDFVNPANSVIVGNLRADFTSEDLEIAFGNLGAIRSAHVFGNRIYSVPLLSKEEIVQHIDWETQADANDNTGNAPLENAPNPHRQRRVRKRASIADSLLKLEEEKKHRVYGLVEFEDQTSADSLCCDSLMLFGSYINGRMCPVINRADTPYSLVVHNISLAVARCEVDETLNSILPPALRIEVMHSCSYNWFETQKAVRIRYPNFLQALAAKTLLDGTVLKGRELAVDWDVSVPEAPVQQDEIDLD